MVHQAQMLKANSKKKPAAKMQLFNENHNTCSLALSGSFGHPTV
jgi:hypothetical protein